MAAQGTVYIDIDAVNTAYQLLNSLKSSFDAASQQLISATQGTSTFNTIIAVNSASPASSAVATLDQNYNTLYTHITGDQTILDSMVSTLSNIISDAEALTNVL